jgi:hypothetical protein
MSEEIYVVVADNHSRHLDTRVEYVGTDANEALRVCEENRGHTRKGKLHAFVQVWQDEEQQYVTRTNIRSSLE